MNEFELIHKYFSNWSGVGTEPTLGIGDDAALLELEPDTQMVVAADTLVEGRHFPENADPGLVASRALRVNVSDMAAMGAEPLHYTLCLTLPSSHIDWISLFSTRLREESERFSCSLIGGDTTRGQLCMSLQMLGKVKSGEALQRSGAKADDDIWVTGNLGDAAAYTSLNFSDDWSSSSFAQKFWSPEPRLQFAQDISGLASACLDISDGLLADLGHICKASGVGAEISLSDIPQSPELQDQFPDQSLQLAISGGDDYELCFTAPPESNAQLLKIADEQGLNLTKIGNIIQGSGVTCLDDKGSAIKMSQAGYSHF